MVIRLEHPIFAFERSNIELRTLFDPSLIFTEKEDLLSGFHDSTYKNYFQVTEYWLVETFIFQDYVQTLKEPICCWQRMNCTYLLEKDSDGFTFLQKRNWKSFVETKKKVDFDDSCISSKIFWKIATSTHFSNKKMHFYHLKEKDFSINLKGIYQKQGTPLMIYYQKQQKNCTF